MSNAIKTERTEITKPEIIAYSVVWFIGTLFQVCQTIGVGEECQGFGAQYPGGCPEYVAAAHEQIGRFLCLDFLGMVVLLWLFASVPTRWGYRILVFLLYALFVLIGPTYLWVPTH